MNKPKKRKKARNLTSRQQVAKLEKELDAARFEMENREPGRGAGIVNRIFDIERQLTIAKGHVKSKFDAVGNFKVEGSYGSGKRR